MDASIRLMRPENMRVTHELAQQELEHVNRIRGLLDEQTLQMEDLRTELARRVPPSEQIIRTSPIADDADERAVLRVALEREENTRRTYEMMATFTTLSREVVGLVAFLAQEEARHASRIRERLDAQGV